MISVENWALIRRLVADGVPQRQVAREFGIGRVTVARAVASGCRRGMTQASADVALAVRVAGSGSLMSP